MDKIKEVGLTVVEANKVKSPAFKELPLTLECKLLYRQEQVIDLIPEDIQKRYYSKGEEKDNQHIIFIGEIVDSYILKDE